VSQEPLDKTAYRAIARQRVEHLLALLKAQPQTAAVGTAAELATHLGRAIDAFHMEAIRFRMYTLDRLVASGTMEVSPELRDTLRDLKHALEAAGFQTRSISH
jgi:hypothetical protein